jgi:hypothetical protein
MKRAWGSAVLAAGLIAALGACSDSSDGSADSTSVEDSVATSSTSVPATSSSLATTSSTSSTATTVPPTTVPVEDTVTVAYLELYDAYWACLRAPELCDPTQLTASIGPARAALTKTVTDLVTGGLFVGDDDQGYVVVESVAIVDPATAVVSSCWWDTGVLYGPPATAGGDPVVINNLQVTSRFETTMALEGGRWLTSEEKRTERVEGENQCPPKG